MQAKTTFLLGLGLVLAMAIEFGSCAPSSGIEALRDIDDLDVLRNDEVTNRDMADLVEMKREIEEARNYDPEDVLIQLFKENPVRKSAASAAVSRSAAAAAAARSDPDKDILVRDALVQAVARSLATGSEIPERLAAAVLASRSEDTMERAVAVAAAMRIAALKSAAAAAASRSALKSAAAAAVSRSALRSAAASAAGRSALRSAAAAAASGR